MTTNGLLRGQMVSVKGLDGLIKNGMGMAPAQLALDTTDELLAVPGVTDETGDFHDGLLTIDTDSARSLPWSADGHNLLLLSQFTDENAAFCPTGLNLSTLCLMKRKKAHKPKAFAISKQPQCIKVTIY